MISSNLKTISEYPNQNGYSIKGSISIKKGKKREKKHKLKKGKQVQHGSEQGDLLNTFSIVFTLLRKTVLLPRKQIFTLIA